MQQCIMLSSIFKKMTVAAIVQQYNNILYVYIIKYNGRKKKTKMYNNSDNNKIYEGGT